MRKQLIGNKTSWQPVNRWYDKLVGQRGQEFHEKVIFPELLKALNLNEQSSVLDLGCGQGVLSRQIPKEVTYLGIDASSGLIESAKKRNHNSAHQFQVGDVTKSFKLKQQFSHAVFLLSLQNMEHAENAIKFASEHLMKNGQLILVMNHPTFRIPRQSSWGIDEKNKTQYRRIDRYRSFLKIPITAHPGKSRSAVTWSYHYSLEQLSTFLYESGLSIKFMKELYSMKQSEGKVAKMENRARSEFPLFLLISAVKSR